jgi:hypothetical protein
MPSLAEKGIEMHTNYVLSKLIKAVVVITLGPRFYDWVRRNWKKKSKARLSSSGGWLRGSELRVHWNSRCRSAVVPESRFCVGANCVFIETADNYAVPAKQTSQLLKASPAVTGNTGLSPAA